MPLVLQRLPLILFFCGTLVATAQDSLAEKPNAAPLHGIIQDKSPSIPQYFTWINNTNEGATAEQTLINLRFFKWLHDEYGMRLGIYAFDAGAIDSQEFYGSMHSARFRKRFPQGFKEIAELAKSFDCRLGIWAGPDGFGSTPEQEKARTEMLVSLCRDYGLQLFKFDAVCGQLRDGKQQAFINAMSACRQYAPDLVVLNHRLNLSAEAKRQVTTNLWEGEETYIDVHMSNKGTATHNRAGVLERGLPPGLARLTEDCGVCLSSALDFWEDDLVLQAFNRSLILAPQLYGNPWLLRDDEFPKLARIFNLHQRNSGILVHGMTLPARYGMHAVARGDDRTRFVTLRNPGWNPLTIHVRLNEEIGLTSHGEVELRQYHPSEQILGTFDHGATVPVTVDPFRACLLMATVAPNREIGITGCRYEVVRDTPGKPVKIKLLGTPGTTQTIKFHPGARSFRKAGIDGRSIPGIFDEGTEITFPGSKTAALPHRKLAELQPIPVPADAEALYEATCFTAPNDALEVQSLRRSGPSSITPVNHARNAFFNQELFWRRGIWDKYLFDRRDETFLSTFLYKKDMRLSGGSLRVDFGMDLEADTIRIKTLHDPRQIKPTPAEIEAEIGSALDAWTPIVFRALPPETGKKIPVAEITKNGGEHEYHPHDLQVWEAKIPDGIIGRYLRLTPSPDRTAEVELWGNGKPLRIPGTPRATTLFAPYAKAPAAHAWKANISLPAHPIPNSRLCVALSGEHGKNGAYAALRLDGKWIGAPQRAVSYPCVAFEFPPRSPSSNYTYFFPITPEMHGRSIEVVVLGQSDCDPALKPEVWATTYPHPFASMEMVVE